MTAKIVTLWAPNLLAPDYLQTASAELQALSLPSLKNLIAKADKHPVKKQDFFSQASYLAHQADCLPVAATQLAGLLPDTWQAYSDHFWLQVDPVQVIPDRDTLVLLPPSQLALTERESHELMAAFNEHFAQDGLVLHFASTHHWLLSIPQAIDLRTTPLFEAQMRSINDFLPQGNAGAYWHQLINEAQMLFYMHPVNQARREQGLPEVNSIWPWGEGQLNAQQVQLRAQACFYSDHPYVKGLANLTQAQSQPSVRDYQTWRTSVGFEQKQHWIHLPQPENFELDEWLAQVASLERNWLVPLEQALEQGKINALLLDLGLANQLHLTPKDLKRFWRWPKKRLV